MTTVHVAVVLFYLETENDLHMRPWTSGDIIKESLINGSSDADHMEVVLMN